jgi:muramoyltetrapeptide carboxypeptidase
MVGFFLLLEQMIVPPFLQAGDTIRLVAPARKPSAASITDACNILQSWGLNVELGEHILTHDHPYFASDDAARCSDLQKALDDVSIKAVICIRGGYGTTRILDSLNFDSFLNHPKWIVGFSDITALHLKLQQLGVQSIHGTMPVMFSGNNALPSVESLRNVLFGNKPELTFTTHKKNIPGNATGELVGGNLSLLVDSLGTESELQTKNKILIIEEIDEYLYKIDRMLVQLKRAGKFKNVSAVLVGHMSEMKDTEFSFGEEMEAIFLHHLSALDIPLAFNFPSGHENPNIAWAEGAWASVSITSPTSTLHYL